MAELTTPGPRDEAVSVASEPTLGNSLGSCVFKFLIGFFASVCAVFLPKIVVYLKNEGGETLKILSTEYVVAGLVFAALIGCVILLFEWSKRSKPAEVFMTALGIPALVSGTLGTVGTADNLKLQAELQRQIVADVARAARVPILDTPITLPAGAAEPQGRVFELIPSAMATPTGENIVLAQGQQAQYGVQAVRREFLVVLAQTPNRAEADAKARALKGQFPDVAVVPSGQQFYVTTTSRPLSEAQALSAAVQLRNAGVSTALVPVRN
jgi:hypothetical protein